MAFIKFLHVLEYIFKICLDILSQTSIKSGFGASDELSSDDEEGVQPVEVLPPVPHQERLPAPTLPTSAPAASVRKRNLNPKPALRPQVNLVVPLCVNETGVRCVLYISCVFLT